MICNQKTNRLSLLSKEGKQCAGAGQKRKEMNLPSYSSTIIELCRYTTLSWTKKKKPQLEPYRPFWRRGAGSWSIMSLWIHEEISTRWLIDRSQATCVLELCPTGLHHTTSKRSRKLMMKKSGQVLSASPRRRDTRSHGSLGMSISWVSSSRNQSTHHTRRSHFQPLLYFKVMIGISHWWKVGFFRGFCDSITSRETLGSSQFSPPSISVRSIINTFVLQAVKTCNETHDPNCDCAFNSLMSIYFAWS